VIVDDEAARRILRAGHEGGSILALGTRETAYHPACDAVRDARADACETRRGPNHVADAIGRTVLLGGLRGRPRALSRRGSRRRRALLAAPSRPRVGEIPEDASVVSHREGV
jgi:hypothetical protein